MTRLDDQAAGLGSVGYVPRAASGPAFDEPLRGQSDGGQSAALVGRVEQNARTAARLIGIVEARLDRSRLDSAMGWAHIAAAFSVHNPSGALRSAPLDAALDQVSLRTMASTVAAPVPGRVLHVFTETHRIGGHIRFALRWAELDDREMCVVVTRPGADGPEIHEVAARAGGFVEVLADRSLVARARRLRELAQRSEVVVCHVNPDDPVPAVAFGGTYAGPPIVKVDHADHLFGLGLGNLSVVAGLRSLGIDTGIRARGYPPGGCTLLPTPVVGMDRVHTRTEAKERLGIDPGQVVALTLGRGLKYRPSTSSPGFIDLIEPVFASNRAAVLLAVGPDVDDPSWAGLARRTAGRARAVGLQSDPRLFLDAADVYLDSYPFGSTTSLLEAATHDLAILALRPHRGLSRLLGSSGMLDDAVVAHADTDVYQQELQRLLGDAARRDRLGARAGESAREQHGPEGWRVHLDALYALAATRPPVVVPARTSCACSVVELTDYATALMSVETGAPLLWPVLRLTEHLDRRDRLPTRLRSTAVRAVRTATGHRRDATAVGDRWLVPMR